MPARTRGPLGHDDAADPSVKACLGDTPGPLGQVDSGAPFSSTEIVVCQNEDDQKSTANEKVRVTPVLARVEKRQSSQSADVYYLYTHVRVDYTINNPTYADAVKKWGEETVKKAGIPPTMDMFAEFGPEGGAIVSIVTTLLGIPVTGQVIIGGVTDRDKVPTWQKVVFGRGYESNQKEDESVFPTLGRVPREFWDSVVNDKKLTLDAEVGDRIHKRAEMIRDLAKENRYLYLVTQDLGPLLGAKVMGAYHRNCWGFVTDILDEDFTAPP